MTERTPAGSWLKWLLLAAFAACLNPHPDDEPTVTVDRPPGAGDSSSSPGDTSTNGGPPLLIDDESDSAETPPPRPRDIADAGAPSGDAGATSGDAGPAVSH